MSGLEVTLTEKQLQSIAAETLTSVDFVRDVAANKKLIADLLPQFDMNVYEVVAWIVYHLTASEE